VLPRLTPFVLAVLCAAFLDSLDASLAPVPDESGPLRWARVAADHPVRSGLALWLILLAGIPPRARQHPPGTLE